jgi:sugar lactone lactonase YvrE
MDVPLRRCRLFTLCWLISAASVSAATVSEVIPTSGPHGARAVIVGTALDATDITVTFGSSAAAIITRSPKLLEFVVPPTAVTSSIRVANSGGTVATLPFTVTPDPTFVKVSTIAASDSAHDVLKDPSGIAGVLSSGAIYLADSAHHQIKQVSVTGQVSVVAGSGRPGLADGTGSQAQFNQPRGLVFDSERKILYVADSANNLIRKMTPDGNVSVLAGSGRAEDVDGTGTQAGFKQPIGVALDAAGNIYVADTGNSKIKVVTPGGAAKTIAGAGHEGFADGPALQALFKQPEGIAVASSGAIYIADTQNNLIRKFENGIVSTVAGTGHGGLVDGAANLAEFNQPAAVAIEDGGNLWIADRRNDAIRKVSLGVSTIAGMGSPGYVDGTPATSQWKEPSGIVAAGAIFVGDTKNGALRVIYPATHASAIYPRRGPLMGGNVIRVFGSGFIPGATEVTFGGVAATALMFVASTELLATVPSGGAGSVDVKASTTAGNDTLAGAYTYLPPPTVVTIQPHKGRVAGGETITITGTNFAGNGEMTVTIGGSSATSVIVNSSTSLTLVTPPGTAAADVLVTTPGGTATTTGGFVYFAPPGITSFSPGQGGAGTAVTITGQNFDPDATGDQVLFGLAGATLTSATAPSSWSRYRTARAQGRSVSRPPVDPLRARMISLWRRLQPSASPLHR